jgi:metallo-beta-lactamase class B
MRRRLFFLFFLLFFRLPITRAGLGPEYTAPIAPFRIAEGLYYVGTRDLASYLITTSDGNILINSDLECSVPLIRHSIEQLGFRWTDTKILLISHAHSDHDAGSAAILRATHAKYMVMDGDVPVVESGGRADFAFGRGTHYPPAHVDRVLHDGDTVRLGKMVLTAHKTAGHTRGCTTWTFRTADGLNAVIIGSWSVLSDYRLAGPHASYPGIADDYAHSFAVYKSLPCDLFLGSHGGFFDMLVKLQKLNVQPNGRNPFIDPAGYKAAVAENEQRFLDVLHKQQANANTTRTNVAQ